jgi:hypothetical protein
MAKIFISYSRVDEPFARELAAALTAMGADVWIDVEDIPAGQKWSSAIQQGLDVCDALLVVISPEAMASTNVEDEWQYFLDQKRPVFPILYRPAKIHFQLSRIQYIDFSRQPFARAILQLNAELRRRGIGVQPMAGATGSIAPVVQPPLPTTDRPRRFTLPIIGGGTIAIVIGILAALGAFNSPSPVPTPTSSPSHTAAALVPSDTPAPASSVSLTPASSPTPLATATPAVTATRTRRGTPLSPTDIAGTEAAFVATQIAIEDTADWLTENAVLLLTQDALLETLESFTDTPTPDYVRTVQASRLGTRQARTQSAAATATQVALVSPTPVPNRTPAAIVCDGAPPTRLNIGMRATVTLAQPGQNRENLNVRQTPTVTAALVTALSQARGMYITGAPVCGDGFVWFPIETIDGQVRGWAAEGQFIAGGGGDDDDDDDEGTLQIDYFLTPVTD